MPCRRAIAPTPAAGFTTPPLVGTWVSAINFTRSSIIDSSASREIWPCWSSGATSMTAPVRRATCNIAMALLAYSVRPVSTRSPGANRIP